MNDRTVKRYPDGLNSDSIPLFASIIAIADTYDAMTSTRPYRSAFSEDIALRELVRVAGTQLRADLVAVFVGLIDKGSFQEKQKVAGRAL